MAQVVSLLDHQVLTERVYQALKAAIFSLDFLPGAPLIERDLAVRFGVSKSPVREALHRLVGEGLVTQTPYRGMTVRKIGADEADELYALHEVLEEMAVALATPRLTESDLRQAREILVSSLEPVEQGEEKQLARLNRDFHSFFVDRSGNRPLRETLINLHGRVRIINAIGWRRHPAFRVEYDQHWAVLEAAATGDAATASRLMREHIHCFRLGFREAWEQALQNG